VRFFQAWSPNFRSPNALLNVQQICEMVCVAVKTAFPSG
jgi:hypothetical protein